jgi:Mlc titration factor MtfA (ptsG expression regulator)
MAVVSEYYACVFGWLTKRKHAKILETPFPKSWERILEKNVADYKRLAEVDKKLLRDKTQIFIAEKNFEGARDLEVDDEMKVTIAGQACLLIIHLEKEDVFPTVESIVIYPSAFVVPGAQRGHVVIKDQARLGEAWHAGTVVLAWDSTLSGARDPRDGHNLVLHEFAHALDYEDGEGDGAPVLQKRAMYSGWSHVLGAEFEDLVEATEHGQKSMIDSYGATNPAEFFAVVTEAFFEKGRQMKSQHPELYEQLASFYGQDPASRS